MYRYSCLSRLPHSGLIHRHAAAGAVFPRALGQINVKMVLFRPAMRPLPVLLTLTCSLALAASLPAAEQARKVQVTASRTQDVTVLRVDARAASARELLEAIEPHLGQRVVVRAEHDPRIDYRAARVRPLDAVREVVARAGLQLARENDIWVVSDPSEPTFTIDVKDGEVREIMREVKRQCGIRNLIIDPDVQGRGTFLFRDLPCSEAIRTILATMGLDYEIESSVMRVAADR